MPGPSQITQAYLLAALPVQISALVVPHILPALLAVAALLMLLRLAWLDDNIVNDLVDRERLPNSYQNTLSWRQGMIWQLLARRPEADPARVDPGLLATSMRAEAHSILAVILGGLPVALAPHTSPVLGLGLIVALGAGALIQIDRLAGALVHLDMGQPLPRARLLCRVAGRVAPGDDASGWPRR